MVTLYAHPLLFWDHFDVVLLLVMSSYFSCLHVCTHFKLIAPVPTTSFEFICAVWKIITTMIWPVCMLITDNKIWELIHKHFGSNCGLSSEDTKVILLVFWCTNLTVVFFFFARRVLFRNCWKFENDSSSRNSYRESERE